MHLNGYAVKKREKCAVQPIRLQKGCKVSPFLKSFSVMQTENCHSYLFFSLCISHLYLHLQEKGKTNPEKTWTEMIVILYRFKTKVYSFVWEEGFSFCIIFCCIICQANIHFLAVFIHILCLSVFFHLLSLFSLSRLFVCLIASWQICRLSHQQPFLFYSTCSFLLFSQLQIILIICSLL